MRQLFDESQTLVFSAPFIGVTSRKLWWFCGQIVPTSRGLFGFLVKRRGNLESKQLDGSYFWALPTSGVPLRRKGRG